VTGPESRPGDLAGAAIGALAMAVLCRSLVFVFAKLAALGSEGGGLVAILWNPWYWAELGALAAQSGFWILVLRTTRLAVAYPTTALVYALNLAWAWALFGESVTPANLVGCGIIVVGVAIAATRAREPSP